MRLDEAVSTGLQGPTQAALDELDKLADQTLGFTKKGVFRDYFESIGFAVFIALLLRAFVVEAFKIPSPSMVPTLRPGDHIFVNKFIYGLRVPMTNAWFVQWGTPSRGDVIVFRYPPDTSKDYIKRVVAVAGDRIVANNERVSINGQDLEQVQVEPHSYGPRYGTFTETSREAEATYVVQYTPGLPDKSIPRQKFDWGFDKVEAEEVGLDCEKGAESCIVKEGYIVVLGDNRNKSADSRTWGAVPTENVKGKALFIWGSWGKHFFDFRWERVGNVIR